MAKLSSITSASAADIQATWDRAIDHLRAVDQEYAEIDPQHTAAFDAAEAECPREAEFFNRYNLGCYENEERGRERNLRAARMAIVTERCQKIGRMLTAVEAEEVATEAARVVDEFETWQLRRDEAHKKHDCDMWEERFDAVVDKRWAARDAVIEADAPDLQAMRVKLELLADIVDGDQDQERVIAIRNDARRLVGA